MTDTTYKIEIQIKFGGMPFASNMAMQKAMEIGSRLVKGMRGDVVIRKDADAPVLTMRHEKRR